MSWPYRLEDWAFALALGQGYVLLDRAGTVIATAAWWAYGEDPSFSGDDHRRESCPRPWPRCPADGCAAGGGAPAHDHAELDRRVVALYERRGFVRIGVIQQHQGVPHARPEAPPASLVRAMAPSDVEAVARLDRQATGWARRPMLDRLIQAGDGHVLVRDGEPRGCAISRLFAAATSSVPWLPTPRPMRAP